MCTQINIDFFMIRMNRQEEKKVEDRVKRFQVEGFFPSKEAISTFEVVVFESFFRCVLEQDDDYYSSCEKILKYYQFGSMEGVESSEEKNVIIYMVESMVGLYIDVYLSYKASSLFRGEKILDEKDDKLVLDDLSLMEGVLVKGIEDAEGKNVTCNLMPIHLESTDLISVGTESRFEISSGMVSDGTLVVQANDDKREFASQLKFISGRTWAPSDNYRVLQRIFVLSKIGFKNMRRSDVWARILKFVQYPYLFRCVNKQAYRYYLDWVKVEKEKRFSMKNPLRDKVVCRQSGWLFPVEVLSNKIQVEARRLGYICSHVQFFCVECNTESWFVVLQYLRDNIISYYNTRFGKNRVTYEKLSFLEAVAKAYDVAMIMRKELLRSKFMVFIKKYLSFLSIAKMMLISRMSLDMITCIWFGGYRDDWLSIGDIAGFVEKVEPSYVISEVIVGKYLRPNMPAISNWK